LRCGCCWKTCLFIFNIFHFLKNFIKKFLALVFNFSGLNHSNSPLSIDKIWST
jgi:hypothetical protein